MKLKNSGITFITILLSLFIGGIIIAMLGYNPLNAYLNLFKGAFVGKLNFGTTIEKFVPLLLTGLAFIISSKVSVFNVGVEGELYLGAIAAAWVGYSIKGLPGPLHIGLCFLVAMLVGAIWAAIPGALKAYWKVNEVCVTILMNYVAIFFTSYLVNGPLSAKTGIPQTPAVADNALLLKILKPSRANIGLFIAITLVIFFYWFFKYTTLGYKLRSVGLNSSFSDYLGIDSKRNMLYGMMISGAVGGIAGAIEVLGIYGYFLDSFSPGIAFDGMIAALIAKNDIRLLPIFAFFLATLKSGALGMERFTGVPKSIIDTIIAMFIIFVAMEGIIKFADKRGLKFKRIKMMEKN